MTSLCGWTGRTGLCDFDVAGARRDGVEGGERGLVEGDRARAGVRPQVLRVGGAGDEQASGSGRSIATSPLVRRSSRPSAAELDVTSAPSLLSTLPPAAAPRAWMDRYAAFFAAKRGIPDTLRAG